MGNVARRGGAKAWGKASGTPGWLDAKILRWCDETLLVCGWRHIAALVAPETFVRFVARATRLYEQEPGEALASARLGLYVRRWVTGGQARGSARRGCRPSPGRQLGERDTL